MEYIVFVVVLLLFVVIVYVVNRKNESFNIPVRESSAWGWNTGPGYGAGYGTGYGMFGLIPCSCCGGRKCLCDRPLNEYDEWTRRPMDFVTPFTPVPQIDYNYSTAVGGPLTNIRIGLVGGKVAANGLPGKTLQLDRNRLYYFAVELPSHLQIVDDNGHNYLQKAVSVGILPIEFNREFPQKLYYGYPGCGQWGTIYLNFIRPQF